MSNQTRNKTATYTLRFQNSHALSTHYNFRNVEHARDAYRQMREQGFYTHYELRIDGEIKQKGKII